MTHPQGLICPRRTIATALALAGLGVCRAAASASRPASSFRKRPALTERGAGQTAAVTERLPKTPLDR